MSKPEQAESEEQKKLFEEIIRFDEERRRYQKALGWDNDIPWEQDEATEGPVFRNLLDLDGWKARVVVEAKNRTTKHFLYISNTKFGFQETRMSGNNWRKTQGNFKAMYLNDIDARPKTKKDVEQALRLLLLYCEKNLTDLPRVVVDKMVDLGFFFCLDLYHLARQKFEESDWQDWGIFWRNKYYALLDEIEGTRKPKAK